MVNEPIHFNNIPFHISLSYYTETDYNICYGRISICLDNQDRRGKKRPLRLYGSMMDKLMKDIIAVYLRGKG